MKTAFFDIDSQLDFLLPAGALYVPGAEHIVPAIARLNRFAASSGIPVVSTVDAHDEHDPEFSIWPPHCVQGTHGQRKAGETLLERRVRIPNQACELNLSGAQQIIVEKQTVDVFQSLNLERVVQQLAAERFVVYGVVSEICVLFAARGLLRAGRRVTVVTDAIKPLSADGETAAFQEIRELGGELAPLAAVCT